NPLLVMGLIDALDRLLTINADHIAGISKSNWQSLVGASLVSYIRLRPCAKVSKYSRFERGDTSSRVQERVRNKQFSTSDQPADKKWKAEFSQSGTEEIDSNNVTQLLLLIEEAPISVSTSRNVIILISKIQMAISAGRVPEAYVILLLNGIIVVFHKRFGLLWDPAVQCLTVLMEKHVLLVWERFVRYLEQCQTKFINSDNHLESVNVESSSTSSDLVECFHSFVAPNSDVTPCATILSLLLQSLQKVHTIAESRSRQLVPLFLKFLGYDDGDL
ncbi:hypothetical protein MKX01_006626, partial [Papaver californicum]